MDDKENETKLINGSMVPWLKYHGGPPECVQAKTRRFCGLEKL